MYRVMCMTYTVRFVTNSVDKNDHLWQRQLEYQLNYIIQVNIHLQKRAGDDPKEKESKKEREKKVL